MEVSQLSCPGHLSTVPNGLQAAYRQAPRPLEYMHVTCRLCRLQFRDARGRDHISQNLMLSLLRQGLSMLFTYERSEQSGRPAMHRSTQRERWGTRKMRCRKLPRSHVVWHFVSTSSVSLSPCSSAFLIVVDYPLPQTPNGLRSKHRHGTITTTSPAARRRFGLLLGAPSDVFRRR